MKKFLEFLKNDRLLICIVSFVIAGLIIYANTQIEERLPALTFAILLCPVVGINALFLDKRPGDKEDKKEKEKQ